MVGAEISTDVDKGAVLQNGIELTRHVVYGHGVLADHALPVLVGEQFEVFAPGNRSVVETGAEPFHGRRLAHGHGRFDALPEHADVVRMGQIVVVQQWVLIRIVAPEQNSAPALRPQHHREHAERVPAVQVAHQLLVEIVAQTVRLLGGRPAVRIGGRGRQHELDIRPVVRLVTVLGRDKSDRF